MSELRPGDVREMTAALGLAPTDEDITEVTHRLNALLEVLASLSDLPLDSVEPLHRLTDPDHET